MSRKDFDRYMCRVHLKTLSVRVIKRPEEKIELFNVMETGFRRLWAAFVKMTRSLVLKMAVNSNSYGNNEVSGRRTQEKMGMYGANVR